MNERNRDPLNRGCTACGVAVGEGCRTVGKDGKPLNLPRIPHATRLVHAARLEEGNAHA